MRTKGKRVYQRAGNDPDWRDDSDGHRLSNFAQADEGKEKVRKLIEMTKSSGVNLRDTRPRVNHYLT